MPIIIHMAIIHINHYCVGAFVSCVQRMVPTASHVSPVVGTILCTQLTKGPDAVVINMDDSHMDDDRHMDDDSRRNRHHKSRKIRADTFSG